MIPLPATNSSPQPSGNAFSDKSSLPPKPDAPPGSPPVPDPGRYWPRMVQFITDRILPYSAAPEYGDIHRVVPVLAFVDQR